MKARFELKKTSGGEFMFNLIAANQEIILTSQMYQDPPKRRGRHRGGSA